MLERPDLHRHVPLDQQLVRGDVVLDAAKSLQEALLVERLGLGAVSGVHEHARRGEWRGERDLEADGEGDVAGVL